MATVFNIETVITVTGGFTTDVWDTSKLANGSVQFVWSSLNAGDGQLDVYVSNDNVNFDVSGCADPVAVDTTSGTHVYEFRGFTTRYVRFAFTPGAVTTGQFVIRSYAQPANMTPGC